MQQCNFKALTENSQVMCNLIVELIIYETCYRKSFTFSVLADRVFIKGGIQTISVHKEISTSFYRNLLRAHRLEHRFYFRVSTVSGGICNEMNAILKFTPTCSTSWNGSLHICFLRESYFVISGVFHESFSWFIYICIEVQVYCT